MVAPPAPGDVRSGVEYAVTRVVPAGAQIEVKRNGDRRDPSLHAAGAAAQAPAARGRALARIRVVGADRGAARYVHRLPFRQGAGSCCRDQLAVGNPGVFVGLANFYKIFNDAIFRHATSTIPSSTRRHYRVQARPRDVAGHAAQPDFRAKALARASSSALHHPDRPVDSGLEVDVRPDLQRAELAPLPSRLDHQSRIDWLTDPTMAPWSRWSS